MKSSVCALFPAVVRLPRYGAAVALCSAVLITSALAQTAPSPAPGAATLAKYDRNQNGVLESSELAAIEDDRKRQPVPEAMAATDDAAGPPLVLSAFEVVENTRGYFSANTMSGTRFNSKLEDLGSSITVVTKKQMEDFAMLDIHDVFTYEAGTEGSGTFTDFSFDRNGAPVDNTQLNPNSANRIRGVGSANITFGSFETSGRTPIDPIDIDAVEISRGPNSNIFGIGSAAGTVNTVRSTANLQQHKTRVTTRVDSFEGYRGSLDVNRVLRQGMLALRASAVYQREGFDLKPSGMSTERYNGMLKFKPFKATTLTASYAYYRNYGNRPNTTTPRDAITGWIERGRPTWDPVTATATINGVAGQPVPAGVMRTYPRDFSVISVEPRGITYWQPLRTTTTNSPVSQNGPRQFMFVDQPSVIASQPLIPDTIPLVDRTIYDWSSLNLASGNHVEDKSEIASVLVDHVVFSTERHALSAQVGWFREAQERYTRNLIGPAPSINSNGLQIDIMERRLDGTPNPNFLRPFFNVNAPQTILAPIDRDTYRGQLAYKLDLTREKNALRWLGRHELGGYLEYKNFKSWSRRYRDAIISNHAWLGEGISRGTDGRFGGLGSSSRFAQGNYFFYLGDNQGYNVEYGGPDYRTGTYPLTWGNAATGTFVQEPAVLGAAVSGNTGGNANLQTVLRTRGAVLQSHFLGGRIVTTLGLRNDARYSKTGAPVQLQQNGYQVHEDTFLAWMPDWDVGKGKTDQRGVVVKPFRWLSLYANQSNSFQPRPPRHNLFLEKLPDSVGEGKDYGIMLNLFEGKLFIRANFYTTAEKDSRQGQAATFGTRLLVIDRPNVPGQNAAPPPYQLQGKATEWVLAAAAARGQTLSNDQVLAQVKDIMKLPDAYFEPLPQTASTSDVTARGKEIEINYNPSAHWTMKLNVTEQESISNNIAPDVVKWLRERIAVWETIIDPTINRPWYTERYNNAQSAQQRTVAGVSAPLGLAIATEGLSRPQIRKYRANFITSYHLAGVSEHRWLKRMNVGGGLRWEDKGGIGYWGMQELPARITEYDPMRPIYDQAHFYADAFVGYRTRIFRDKVGATFQLNVRNIGESGRLQPIAAAPDGRMSAFRIISPRQFILSATFDL